MSEKPPNPVLNHWTMTGAMEDAKERGDCFTLRDLFAAFALQGLLASLSSSVAASEHIERAWENAPAWALKIADAMLKERSKG